MTTELTSHNFFSVHKEGKCSYLCHENGSWKGAQEIINDGTKLAKACVHVNPVRIPRKLFSQSLEKHKRTPGNAGLRPLRGVVVVVSQKLMSNVRLLLSRTVQCKTYTTDTYGHSRTNTSIFGQAQSRTARYRDAGDDILRAAVWSTFVGGTAHQAAERPDRRAHFAGCPQKNGCGQIRVFSVPKITCNCRWRTTVVHLRHLPHKIQLHKCTCPKVSCITLL